MIGTVHIVFKHRYPLVEEVQAYSVAPQLFELIADRPYSFLLDSGMDHQKLGRYSFMGSDPFLVMSSRGSEITLVRGHKREVQQGNPFDVLGKLLELYRVERSALPVPFAGGAVGYFSYELRHFIERLPCTTVDDLGLPECYFAFYDAILGLDHLQRKAYVIATGFPELQDEQRLKRATTRMEEMKCRLRPSSSAGQASGGAESSSIGALAVSSGAKPAEGRLPGPGLEPAWPGGGGLRPAQQHGRAVLKSNFTPDGYIKAVDRVREYIAAGDVFQVNLSQRLEAAVTVPPYELFKRLRKVNPAPFSSYLSFPEVTVVGASPERFLRVQGDVVETRPVKGTRPRGTDAAEDERLAEELTHSVKDRAENVMIVDLERNDQGRVCRYGTVRVTELAILEAFSTVFHLTSTIVGRLCQGKSNMDLLKATFPGGSVTGAPKIRAMQIIDELEPTTRSVYTGSLGYLSFNGDLDISIVIRTLLIKEGRAYFQVGGGIIYDSDAGAEYTETMDKARALIEAL